MCYVKTYSGKCITLVKSKARSYPQAVLWRSFRLFYTHGRTLSHLEAMPDVNRSRDKKPTEIIQDFFRNIDFRQT
jgi:hypothetical protein